MYLNDTADVKMPMPKRMPKAMLMPCMISSGNSVIFNEDGKQLNDKTKCKYVLMCRKHVTEDYPLTTYLDTLIMFYKQHSKLPTSLRF